MKTITVFSSILIATLAIQTLECTTAHGVDSFFPLRQSSNSRGLSRGSHSSRPSIDTKKGINKKMETMGFIEPANQQTLNSNNYVNVGGVQHPTNLQEGTIKSGNGMAYSNSNNHHNHRQQYPSQSNTYDRSSQLPISNSFNFPLNC